MKSFSTQDSKTKGIKDMSKRPQKVTFIATLPAKIVYDDLIKRVKEKVKSEESIVFDPETGIQKCFLHGKLLWVKHVRGSNITFKKDPK